MDRLAAMWATHIRNLRLVRRQPTLAAQTLILPTAILLLVAFIFGGGGDRWPVAVVDESQSAASNGFVEALERAESQITPYFDLQSEPYDEAKRRVDSGRLHLLVRLPEDFAESRRVEIATYNINTDAMKNARLRLDHVIATELDTDTGVTTDLRLAQDHTPWRSAYIGGSSTLLALLLGATLLGANLFVLERERHTRTPTLLTPLGPALAGGGHIITATTTAVAASLVPLAVSVWLFHLDVAPARLASVYLAMLPALVGLAGLGILLGQLLGSFRNVQPLVVIAALVTFFGAGGFAPASMLHPALQRFADMWLPSRIFTWSNPVLHGFAQYSAPQVVALLATGLLGVLLAWWAYRREQRLPPQPATN